jgi:hypothetical protein
VGKGGGYSDLECAIGREFGFVNEDVDCDHGSSFTNSGGETTGDGSRFPDRFHCDTQRSDSHRSAGRPAERNYKKPFNRGKTFRNSAPKRNFDSFCPGVNETEARSGFIGLHSGYFFEMLVQGEDGEIIFNDNSCNENIR